jgi:hypothetical protein
MGLSIHYSGKFNKHKCLAEMITEVKEIAETLKWDYQIFEDVFPESGSESDSYDGKIYGINFTPPECETVSICFLSNYRMSCHVNLRFFGNAADPQEKKLLYMLFVKTQFAGIAVHKTIIKIFKHLEKRSYFEELNVVDEGRYWETGDEKLLEQKMKFLGEIIDNFSLAVETIPIHKGESFEDYIFRIAQKINKQNTQNRSNSSNQSRKDL